MQGSYILLAALGIFILIGGARRFLDSFGLNSIGAVLIIIAVVIGNLFPPVGNDIIIYSGTLILGLLCLYYLITSRARFVWGSILSIIVITSVLLIYRIVLIDKFPVSALASTIMIVGGCAISSFILSRTSSQAFIVAVFSIISYAVTMSILNNVPIVLGDSYMFDLIIYSSLGAVLLNEIVMEFSAFYQDRAPDMSFEAGVIEDDKDKKDNN